MLNRASISVGEVHRRMRTLPLAALDAIAPGTSLVLAPHADDESLGCGGLIALASEAGRPPVVVGVTDGVGSHPASPSYPATRLRATREAEMLTATALLGVAPDRVKFLALPDTRAPSAGSEFEAAVTEVVRLAKAFDVTTVFASWALDPHCDHEATAVLGNAVAAATRVRLLFYPVWGWLLPSDQELPVAAVDGMRLDISSTLSRKRRAIAAHASQYSDLIADDPSGFRLPPALLSIFDQPFEVFLKP